MAQEFTIWSKEDADAIEKEVNYSIDLERSIMKKTDKDHCEKCQKKWYKAQFYLRHNINWLGRFKDFQNKEKKG